MSNLLSVSGKATVVPIPDESHPDESGHQASGQRRLVGGVTCAGTFLRSVSLWGSWRQPARRAQPQTRSTPRTASCFQQRATDRRSSSSSTLTGTSRLVHRREWPRQLCAAGRPHRDGRRRARAARIATRMPACWRSCPRDELDALEAEVPTAALRQVMQRHPVAVPLYEHAGAKRGHVTIRYAARPPVNRVWVNSRAGAANQRDHQACESRSTCAGPPPTSTEQPSPAAHGWPRSSHLARRG